MSCYTGRQELGLFKNGTGLYGDNRSFSSYSFYTDDKVSGPGSFALLTNSYGGSIVTGDFVEVDTSKKYRMSVSVKTIQRSYNNRLGSGHLGFSCYDKNFNFIDLRNCGDIGNTFLSRAATPGDTKIYLESSSGWVTGADVTGTSSAFRQILFYPPGHPDYGVAHKYTRLNTLYYNSMVLTEQNDWELTLGNGPLPDYGYSLPIGTPISRGVAGGTYNYAFGAPDYPETWTTYITSVFTGESYNSTTPFRYATKYIKFLNLANYNYRAETAGNSARYLLDNIILLEDTSTGSKLQQINTGIFSRS